MGNKFRSGRILKSVVVSNFSLRHGCVNRPPDFDTEIMTPAARKAPPTKYKLFGVLHHHGLSASGGHYTLDVLHPSRGQTMPPREGWVRIDDEQVWDEDESVLDEVWVVKKEVKEGGVERQGKREVQTKVE